MTRKMQMFYGTLIFLALVLGGSFLVNIAFTGDHITNIIIVFMVFVGAMAGANVGEHFAKAKKNGK